VQNALFCVQNEGVCAKCVQMCAGCVQKFGFVCETQTSEFQRHIKMCAAVCKCVQPFARVRARAHKVLTLKTPLATTYQKKMADAPAPAISR